MQVLTYVLSIEIALTVTVLCREASREREGVNRGNQERGNEGNQIWAAELQLDKQDNKEKAGRQVDGRYFSYSGHNQTKEFVSGWMENDVMICVQKQFIQ